MCSNEVCAICLEEMEEDSGGCVPLECDHVFHSKCAVIWLQSGKSSCPVCRHDPHRREHTFSERNYIPLEDYRSMVKYTIRLSCNLMRRKNVDPLLKSNYDSLMKKKRKSEERSRKTQKDLQSYFKENREILSAWKKRSRCARRSRWCKYGSMRRLRLFHMKNGSKMNVSFRVEGLEESISLDQLQNMIQSQIISENAMVTHPSMSSSYPASVVVEDLMGPMGNVFPRRI